MKKVLILFMCIVIVFSLSSCKKHDAEYESHTSSDIVLDETITIIESQLNTSSTDTESDNNSSAPTNEDTSHIEVSSDAKENSSETITEDNEASYNDIVCTTIINFKQVAFCIKDSNTTLFVTMPKDWTLEKNENGYSILRDSQVIGNVTTLAKSTPIDGSVNVFYTEITTNNIKVTHSIDSIVSDNNTTYNRTLRYKYDSEHEGYDILLTVPYQEIDSSAVYKMITEVKKATTATNTNLGVLQIQDNRNKILILGNSFIRTSQIGQILDTMCGNEASVEAHSRGNSHVETYTSDIELMQKIRSGNYSVVFICGLYNQVSFDALQQMINACKESNTKLAVFPAHNENQQNIERVMSMYPDTVFINWKAEINNLISTGIDVSNFCIPDAHNHSTPLAGYVGAHMIYRAVFNKIPQTTHFTEVSQTQIDLLGEYVTSGSIVMLDTNSHYVIE